MTSDMQRNNRTTKSQGLKDAKDLPLDAGPRRAHPGGVPRDRLPVPDDTACRGGGP
jgi:hypothetical protein